MQRKGAFCDRYQRKQKTYELTYAIMHEHTSHSPTIWYKKIVIGTNLVKKRHSDTETHNRR